MAFQSLYIEPRNYGAVLRTSLAISPSQGLKNAVSNRANSLLYVRNRRREMRDPYAPLMS